MLFLIAVILCPGLLGLSMLRWFAAEGRRVYREAALRDVAARLTEEQDRLRAQEEAAAAAKVDPRPVYRPVELQPSLVAMMERDGFL